MRLTIIISLSGLWKHIAHDTIGECFIEMSFSARVCSDFYHVINLCRHIRLSVSEEPSVSRYFEKASQHHSLLCNASFFFVFFFVRFRMTCKNFDIRSLNIYKKRLTAGVLYRYYSKLLSVKTAIFLLFDIKFTIEEIT